MLGVGQGGDVEQLGERLASLDLDQQHLAPQRAIAIASAAATVVLPVPPLPVTMCSRAVGETPGTSWASADRVRAVLEEAIRTG